MTFRITALPFTPFGPFFDMDGARPPRTDARLVVADASPGFPCRVSLVDAEPGETVLLVNWEHQPAATPFRASHAVYVRSGAVRAEPAPGAVPAMLRARPLSLRGFDAAGMLVAADLADGAALEGVLGPMLSDPAVAYVHLHFAKPGCYAARADRA